MKRATMHPPTYETTVPITDNIQHRVWRIQIWAGRIAGAYYLVTTPEGDITDEGVADDLDAAKEKALKSCAEARAFGTELSAELTERFGNQEVTVELQSQIADHMKGFTRRWFNKN